MSEDETTYLLTSDAMRKRLLSALEREENLPPELERQVTALAAADDETLWQIVWGRFSPAKAARLKALNWQRTTGDWNEELTQEAAQLATEMDEYMLLRAHAMSLLVQRGHDLLELLEHYSLQ